MRVLWLCNTPLNASAGASTGSWLEAMAGLLDQSGEVELCVVAAARAGDYQRSAATAYAQWHVPFGAVFNAHGRQDREVGRFLQEVCGGFRPDIVHVWGSESRWGLMAHDSCGRLPMLVTLQGVKSRIADHWHGGLRVGEWLATIGAKECARAVMRGGVRRSFRAWGKLERQIIRSASRLNCHSPWQAAYARQWNPHVEIDQVELPLRGEIMGARRDCAPVRPSILCSAAYSSPAKGLHVAVRATRLLRDQFEGVELRIAGERPRRGICSDGYLRWVEREITRLGMDANVTWTGLLAGQEMAREISSAAIVLVPSFVESYCLAMAEAQYIGTPVVCSYTGGTGHLGQDEQTCLFFPPGDEVMCAAQLARVLLDAELASCLGESGRAAALERHDASAICRAQIGSYRRVLGQRPSGPAQNPAGAETGQEGDRQ